MPAFGQGKGYVRGVRLEISAFFSRLTAVRIPQRHVLEAPLDSLRPQIDAEDDADQDSRRSSRKQYDPFFLQFDRLL